MRAMLENEVGMLKELGLTLTQAKIYLAILRCNGATAKLISQDTEIAREAVYHTLPSLETIGLITRQLSTPTTYQATSPKKAIYILVKRKKKEYLEVHGKANQVLKNLFYYENFENADSDDDSHKILYSITDNQPTNELMEAMKKVKHTVDFTTRYNLFLHAFNDIQLNDWISEMYKATKRGVKFRMLLHKPEGEKPVSEVSFSIPKSNSFLKCKNFEYRYAPCLLKCIIILFDDKACLIETSQEHDTDVSPHILTNNPTLVALTKTYFESNWNISIT
jgi:sugar-specific transcriptional regulator TrmB